MNNLQPADLAQAECTSQRCRNLGKSKTLRIAQLACAMLTQFAGRTFCQNTFSIRILAHLAVILNNLWRQQCCNICCNFAQAVANVETQVDIPDKDSNTHICTLSKQGRCLCRAPFAQRQGLCPQIHPLHACQQLYAAQASPSFAGLSPRDADAQADNKQPHLQSCSYKMLCKQMDATPHGGS